MEGSWWTGSWRESVVVVFGNGEEASVGQSHYSGGGDDRLTCGPDLSALYPILDDISCYKSAHLVRLHRDLYSDRTLYRHNHLTGLQNEAHLLHQRPGDRCCCTTADNIHAPSVFQYHKRGRGRHGLSSRKHRRALDRQRNPAHL